jgi:hypothetical protein
MAGSEDAVEAFVRTLTDPEPHTREALLGHVTGDVEVLAAFGVGTGPGAVDLLLSHTLVGRVLAEGTVGAPAAAGDLTAVDVTAPTTMPIGGLRFGIHLDANGDIDRIEQDLVPAAPRDPEPIALTDEHARLLAEALANGTPVIVGYVDDGGRPHLSYRATVQVLGPDRLSMWIRDPDGGLARALATNPHLSCFYSDRKAGVTLQFLGRGHVEHDQNVRNRIFEESPKVERDMDWRRRGVAVVIDLDRVEGRDSGGRVLMARPKTG